HPAQTRAAVIPALARAPNALALPNPTRRRLRSIRARPGAAATLAETRPAPPMPTATLAAPAAHPPHASTQRPASARHNLQDNRSTHPASSPTLTPLARLPTRTALQSAAALAGLDPMH